MEMLAWVGLGLLLFVVVASARFWGGNRALGVVGVLLMVGPDVLPSSVPAALLGLVLVLVAMRQMLPGWPGRARPGATVPD